jgi:hypothetical protein
VVIAAGAYELTPVKRHFRRCCRENASSGPGFGLAIAGLGCAIVIAPSLIPGLVPATM